MREDERPALSALGAGLQDQVVLGTSQARPGVGMPSFRMCHVVAPYWISLFL